jgi:hypothetical protein
MFQPTWPSSGVQDSADHCNAVFFPPIVIAYGYFLLHWLHMVAFGSLVVEAFSVLVRAGILFCADRPS